jgi:glycerol-3-phosphate dehydrogenase (NAD(P)+)
MGGFRVLILGDGAMGRTMAHLLADRHRWTMWARDLETWEENVPLEQAARDRDFLLFALPTTPHEEMVRRVAAVIESDCICLTIAKGLDQQGRPAATVMQEYLGTEQSYGVIYGPMIAHEIRSDRLGFARVGIKEEGDFERCRQLFAASQLHIRHTTDIVGLTWAVVLKNAYVPLIAAADALKMGDNVRGYLCSLALGEIERIVQERGGLPGTAYSEAGLGDLITTLTSQTSHHRQMGFDLVAGRFDRLQDEGVNIRGEGVHTIAMLEQYKLIDWRHYPMLSLMRQFLHQPECVKQGLVELMRNSEG